MSKKITGHNNASALELLNNLSDDVVETLKESNKQARKRNRLAKLQYQQSILDYEQAERKYLIEKSYLQPTFRVSATEFLLCEPDYMNDPEQAGEAKYLTDLGYDIDERVLRLELRVDNEVQYMRPNMVLPRVKSGLNNESMNAMTEHVYFVRVDNLKLSDSSYVDAYLVYRDKTTLPVIHKYRLTQRQGSALRRWDVVHRDTVYSTARNKQSNLNQSTVCERLFQV